MSPEKAKVFIAEDDPDWQETIKDILEEEGHTVVLTAKSRAQALAAVKQLDELEIDVAAIDGNLNSYESSGKDGQAVLTAIRNQTPKVKTVGIGGDGVTGVDINVGKDNIREIGKVVTKL